MSQEFLKHFNNSFISHHIRMHRKENVQSKGDIFIYLKVVYTTNVFSNFTGGHFTENSLLNAIEK